ncbi:MAG: 6-phosphofructokinase [Pseudomonadota bacterium]
MKKLLVLTSGGDAPGMNAALRAVVRSGYYYDFQVFGCRGGYDGLIANDIFSLKSNDVANIIQRGGTVLQTGRCKAFWDQKVRAQCIDLLKRKEISSLVVIGGDGSFRGAALLQQEGGPNVIGIPATIDNDIIGTEYTIGFNTAANTALDAIDKIRDTASSHGRHFLIEVMGRRSGFLAVEVGIAGGAEIILTPEFPISNESIVELLYNNKRKKLSNIIIVAEASSIPGRSVKIAQELKALSGLEFKVCILGHTQRGGSPRVTDRTIASQMGEMAVRALNDNKTNLMVAIRNQQLTLTEFPPPDNPGRRFTDESLLHLNRIFCS